MGHIFAGVFWLILAYLVLTNWKGANSLLGTSANSSGLIISDLQGNTQKAMTVNNG